MSNMNHDAFAQGAIVELNFGELEEVNGGGLPLVIGLAFVAVAIKPVATEFAKGFADGMVEGFTDDE
ncbi:class IIb bacteriocin, lactobin A/cerein 7B family [uncultured Erythrobacter sp.]|uniref:class IIb bacteriocin, lactobin A/cerein 7B family n=1 Tax=uncultured Erythrobacter sp. TaxID=263913 RepID=UPI00262ECFF7|nr:class IIb bacteriocin, lactobin A/cerein 7B family [uncultured Erythrobacter sp.]